MGKLVLSIVMLAASARSYSQVLNCHLSREVDLGYLSSITTGFDLQGYFPAEGWKVPDAVTMTVVFDPTFEARLALRGNLQGKKISEKKFLKAWWQKDQQGPLLHYAPYSRSGAPQPSFIVRFESAAGRATLFYKAHGAYAPQRAPFVCR